MLFEGAEAPEDAVFLEVRCAPFDGFLDLRGGGVKGLADLFEDGPGEGSGLGDVLVGLSRTLTHIDEVYRGLT